MNDFMVRHPFLQPPVVSQNSMNTPTTIPRPYPPPQPGLRPMLYHGSPRPLPMLHHGPPNLHSDKEEDLNDDAFHPWLSQLSASSWNWNELSKVVVEPARCYKFVTIINKVSKDTSILIMEKTQSTYVKLADKSYFGQGSKCTAHEFMDRRTPTLQFVAKVFKHTKAHNLEAYKQGARDKLLEMASNAAANGSEGILSVTIYELIDRPTIDYFKYVAVEAYSKSAPEH